MKRSTYTDEQILAILKEGEAGRKVADLCRSHGISEQTYYRWKSSRSPSTWVNATALWVNVAADGMRALQGALFPNGLEWDGQKFGTVVTCTAFSYLREISDSTERVASLSIPS